ncbi:LysR family transcriptional regulator [Paracoccus versutus]|nr:LysR family transcriptional regulator [Paracoccus versutus]
MTARSSVARVGRRISLLSLTQVLAVAEHLNFRHAAEALGMSQSSLSTQIRNLEEEIGIIVFERRHRGVRLTEAGRAFVAEIAAGLGQIDHAVTEGPIEERFPPSSGIMSISPWWSAIRVPRNATAGCSGRSRWC